MIIRKRIYESVYLAYPLSCPNDWDHLNRPSPERRRGSEVARNRPALETQLLLDHHHFGRRGLPFTRRSTTLPNA